MRESLAYIIAYRQLCVCETRELCTLTISGVVPEAGAGRV